MNNQTLAKILTDTFDSEQIENLLEAIYNYPENGACPLCESEDIPIDADGNPLPENASPEQWNSASWRETHDEDCLVTWLCPATTRVAAQEVSHYE